MKEQEEDDEVGSADFDEAGSSNLGQWKGNRKDQSKSIFHRLAQKVRHITSTVADEKIGRKDWAAFCDKHSLGAYNPVKIEESFLRRFLKIVRARGELDELEDILSESEGSDNEIGDALQEDTEDESLDLIVSKGPDLDKSKGKHKVKSTFKRLAQEVHRITSKKSTKKRRGMIGRKEWATFCNKYSQGVYDPWKQESKILCHFLRLDDILSEGGCTDFDFDDAVADQQETECNSSSEEEKQESVPRKGKRKAKSAYSRLVQKVRGITAIDSHGKIGRKQWAAFCDKHSKGVYDPFKQKEDKLRHFLKIVKSRGELDDDLDDILSEGDGKGIDFNNLKINKRMVWRARPIRRSKKTCKDKMFTKR
eukprot:gnl/MRDRNA2_/MRDRNA2_79841_c0_seq1.p1 gnl/MRDRNA2_/MRDRNA2_79841_c0~~gnl/MRDRNA2_/MRDRNA2_79841_c0_seq1.p1  ORF type:complete len:380 (+),score=104.99 gnl/MRDRNA2_/MRDRNA2_79841_c0_seq1:47-1141(+)